jgi:CRISPR/Cas system CSM-associated protein Csm2 small subunit
MKSALNLESEKKINKTLSNRKRKHVYSKKNGEKIGKKKDKWKNIERRCVTLELWINVV